VGFPKHHKHHFSYCHPCVFFFLSTTKGHYLAPPRAYRNLHFNRTHFDGFPYAQFSNPQAQDSHDGPTDPFSQTGGVFCSSSSYVHDSTGQMMPVALDGAESWFGAADLGAIDFGAGITAGITTPSVRHTSVAPIQDIDNPMPYLVTSNAQPTAPPTLEDTTGPETPTSASCALPFKIETKRIYICTHQSCNKKYARLTELRRHQRGAHLNDQRWKCRSTGCDRMRRGFSRRDKRDDHERKVHQRHGVA
jgi:hypothetical protein